MQSWRYSYIWETVTYWRFVISFCRAEIELLLQSPQEKQELQNELTRIRAEAKCCAVFVCCVLDSAVQWCAG